MIPFVRARLAEFGKPAVARVSEPKGAAPIRLANFPRQSMLATPSADEKDVARAWTIGGRCSHSGQVSRRGITAGEGIGLRLGPVATGRTEGKGGRFHNGSTSNRSSMASAGAATDPRTYGFPLVRRLRPRGVPGEGCLSFWRGSPCPLRMAASRSRRAAARSNSS